MLHEKLFVFAFFFVVTLAALIGGEWSASLIDRTDNPQGPTVILMTVVCGVLAFIVLFVALNALGVLGVEDEGSGEG